MEAILDQLKRGVQKFRTEVYPEKAEAYLEAASRPQTPHTLIITCADSRIDPELITQSDTGHIFVTRNVGNMVPAYGEMLGGVSAVIEYAVSALKVKHIVVCGHSDCGAMKGLLYPENLTELPTVSNWLRNASAALAVAKSMRPADEDAHAFLKRVTEENVLAQMQHLHTHPSVAGALARGELTLSGWVYEIGSGAVRVAKDGSRDFEEIGSVTEAAIA